MRYVAFLRAINVAGHAIVKMSALEKAFAAAGCKDVRTYIQSGNVVFTAPDANVREIHEKLLPELRRLIGEEPAVMLRKLA